VTQADCLNIKQQIELLAQGAADMGAESHRAQEKPYREMPVPRTAVTVVDGGIAPVTLTSPSSLALVTSHLVPVVGAFLFGWRLADIIILYWAESAVIALFNVVKIAYIGKWMSLFSEIFFLAYCSGFMSVHFFSSTAYSWLGRRRPAPAIGWMWPTCLFHYGRPWRR
jgi:hypothetical protein